MSSALDLSVTEDVFAFWFLEHGQADWFGGKPEFDAELAARFTETHAAVARGEAFLWRETPRGRLAEIVVLDQFSRQLYRGSGRAFAQDTMALALAQEAIRHGIDRELNGFAERMFLIMPYMHAESLVVQEVGMALFAALRDDNVFNFARGHLETIQQFGRFPFRNPALGRISTEAELAYMMANAKRSF